MKPWLGGMSLHEPLEPEAGDSSQIAYEIAPIPGFHLILQRVRFRNLEESPRFRPTCDEKP